MTENEKDMEKLQSAFGRFSAFVCEPRDWQSYHGDFCDACRDAGIVCAGEDDFIEADLDSLLLSELGMSGDAILEALKGQDYSLLRD